MKKFLFSVLMAALAIPMMQAQRVDLNKIGDVGLNPNSVLTPLKSFDKNVRPMMNMNRGGSTLWDFDTDETFGNWTSLDADQDGNGWGVDNYNGISGSACLSSESWNGTALTPDNWLISEQMPLDGILSIWAKSYNSTWKDNFAVYVCVGEPSLTEDFILISDELITAPASWTEYTFDLSEYAGQMGCFAIRHYNSDNNYRLLIDNISISIPEPMPENLTAVPTSSKATITWDDDNHDAWNLRYRVVNQNPAQVLYETSFEDDVEGWSILDNDGDGYNWGWYEQTEYAQDGDKFLASESWNSTVGAITPDNWLISPEVTLDGNLTIHAWTNYDDNFAVFVTTGDPTDLDSYVMISDDIIPSGAWTEYTFDLSGFEGQTGYFAIRHYNCNDGQYLFIDNVSIIIPGSEDAEWIVIENLDDTQVIISNLDPETTYEVQVQAVGGEWTESTEFTTTKSTSVNEVSGEKTVANVRYFNVAGQEMQEANGMTIVVTTYTDGTKVANKVMK